MEIDKMKEVNIKQYRIGHEPCMQKKNMPEDLAESMAIMEKRGVEDLCLQNQYCTKSFFKG